MSVQLSNLSKLNSNIFNLLDSGAIRELTAKELIRIHTDNTSLFLKGTETFLSALKEIGEDLLDAETKTLLTKFANLSTDDRKSVLFFIENL